MSTRLVVALSLSLALARAPAAFGYCRTTLSPAQPDPTVCPRGTPVAWPTNCVGMHMDPTVLPTSPEVISADEFRSVIAAAARTWAEADCGGGRPPAFRLVPLEDRPGAPIGYATDGANANVVRFSRTWNADSFHPPDAAAVTVVTFGASSARILDADTEINLRSSENPRGAEFSTRGLSTASDLATIVAHEFGHTQGLAHSPLPIAVMWFTAGRGEQRRTLRDDDTAGICAIYPPRAGVVCDPTLRDFRFTGGGCQVVTENVRVELASGLWAVTLLVLRRRRSRR